MSETQQTSDGAAELSPEELKAAHERQRTFLLSEIESVEQALSTLKGKDADKLREDVAFKKQKLEKEDLTFFLLYSSAKDINELKDDVEALVTYKNPLKRISAPVWFSFVPGIIVLYLIVMGFVQGCYNSNLRTSATQTAQAMPTVTATATLTPNP